jgi:hypothetical protein
MRVVNFKLVTTKSTLLWYHVKKLSQLKSFILLDKIPGYVLYYSLKKRLISIFQFLKQIIYNTFVDLYLLFLFIPSIIKIKII